MGWIPAERWLGFVGLGMAFTLITLGLMSSLFHLGHPERSWRAFSQWQSSWLSREGVAAVITYIPFGILGLGWVFFEADNSLMRAMALLCLVGALVTVWCTGMIYASLSTIRQWHHPLVAPLYVVLGLATGAVLFNFILRIFSFGSDVESILAVVAVSVAMILKYIYWRQIDTLSKTYTVGEATGLGEYGDVRPLEPPHTQANFIMREMGYKVARKHAEKLRKLILLLAFVIPVILSLMALLVSPIPATLLALLALVSTGVGIIMERWLFFAEAEHVVMLYYGESKL